MARTITEIYNLNTQKYQEYMTENGYTVTPQNWSATNLLRLAFYVFAFLSHGMEKLWETEKSDLKYFVDNYKPRLVPWYKNKAFDFQFGYDLPNEAIEYDNTGIDENLIAASKVVKYASARGALRGVKIKVAGENNNEPVPLASNQLAACQQYFDRIKGPGVRVYLSSANPDELYLKVRLYYNPLVLDATGKRLDGTDDSPVESAIKAFLKDQNTIRFDGLFVVAKLVDKLQAVEGIEIPEVIESKAKYAAVAWLPFTTAYLPDGGYMKLQELVTEYLPYQNI